MRSRVRVPRRNPLSGRSPTGCRGSGIAVYGDSGTRIGSIRPNVPGLHVDVRQIEKLVLRFPIWSFPDKSKSLSVSFGQHFATGCMNFVGNHPAETDHGKSELMALCESFGAVITEIALDEIAGIVTVSKPPGCSEIFRFGNDSYNDHTSVVGGIP